jgi:hypothetical protein
VFCPPEATASQGIVTEAGIKMSAVEAVTCECENFSLSSCVKNIKDYKVAGFVDSYSLA